MTIRMQSRAVVTTSWDDGHPADFRLAELLSRHDLPGTFYIPLSNCEGRPTLTASGIRSLRRAGFEIGAHTVSHTPLAQIDPRRARREVFECKAGLEDILGEPVHMFCYPKGRFNGHIVDCVRQAGYRGARTTRLLATGDTFPRYEMPTSIQAFPTPAIGYLRNLTKRLAFGSLYNYCTELRNHKNWVGIGRCLFDRVVGHGGIWHLFGHSWELEEFHLWDELKELLTYVSYREEVSYVCNRRVCGAAHDL